MQQKIEAPEKFLIAAKAKPDGKTGETGPVDYDDGLLSTTAPIMILNMGVAICILALTFLASGEALFAVVISAGYVAVFFGLPILLTRIRDRHDDRWTRDVPERTQHTVAVFTGTIKRHEAIAQMLIVPLGLTFAFASFGLIWVLLRPW